GRFSPAQGTDDHENVRLRSDGSLGTLNTGDPMDWNAFLVPALRGLAPYRPGITEEKLRAERGLHEIHKFSSNESPFPPPPGVLAAMQRALEQSNRYPDSGALLDKLAR
ncbi:hypothetical protein SB784_34285, partial [Burkholderia sp. SIMBA_048]